MLTQSAEDQGLGERLSRFAFAIAALLAGLWLFSLWVDPENLGWVAAATGSRSLCMGGIILASLTVSALAARVSAFWVRALDALYAPAFGGLIVGALWGGEFPESPELAAMLVLTLFVTARAALVPAASHTTLAVSILAFAPCLLATTHAFGLAPVDPNANAILFVGVWMSGASAVAAACSHIVYDLRARVATALRMGPYEVGERLGEGGMGRVYRARHARLRRPAAIKLLRGDRVSDRALARFEREVQITAELEHPNTVSIYDYGRTATGTFFYVMELIEGASVDRIVRTTGPLPSGRVVFLLRQVAGALAEAHHRGLLHRDIKPANLMVGTRAGLGDFVTVVDFGLAEPMHDRSADPAFLTGTPQVLAPEVLRGDPHFDARVDLYALGCTAYFMLTGNYPFDAATVAEVCAGHLHVAPTPPSYRTRAEVDPELEQIVMRLLDKSPAKRFDDATALLRAFDALSLREPWDSDEALAWWRVHTSLVQRASSPTRSGATTPLSLAERTA